MQLLLRKANMILCYYIDGVILFAISSIQYFLRVFWIIAEFNIYLPQHIKNTLPKPRNIYQLFLCDIKSLWQKHFNTSKNTSFPKQFYLSLFKANFKMRQTVIALYAGICRIDAVSTWWIDAMRLLNVQGNPFGLPLNGGGNFKTT